MNKLLHIKGALTLGFTFMLLLVSVVSFAQRPNRDSNQDIEKIRQLKIAHLTLELDMTEKQAQSFWPIYNKYDKLIEESRAKRPQLENTDALSDVEAAQILDQMYRSMENQHNHRISMHEELSQILSPKQMLSFYKAEHSFKKRLMERLRGPRGPEGERPGRERNN